MKNHYVDVLPQNHYLLIKLFILFIENDYINYDYSGTRSTITCI